MGTPTPWKGAVLILECQCPAPFPLRQLGHASLCGALYVAYISQDEVLGNYMFCALFRSHLLLAVPRSGKLAFEIVAIIGLNDVQMDEADNGKGKPIMGTRPWAHN